LVKGNAPLVYTRHTSDAYAHAHVSKFDLLRWDRGNILDTMCTCVIHLLINRTNRRKSNCHFMESKIELFRWITFSVSRTYIQSPSLWFYIVVQLMFSKNMIVHLLRMKFVRQSYWVIQNQMYIEMFTVRISYNTLIGLIGD
jgi:hypothetical protein